MELIRWTVAIFALRVPLTCALVLALLAPLGAFSYSPWRGLLEGLFDVTAWGAFWASLFSWLTVAACWVSSLLVLNYGPHRIAGLRRRVTDLEFRLFPWLALGYSVAPLSILAGLLACSEAGGVAIVAGSLAGFAANVAAWRFIRQLHWRTGRRHLLAMRRDAAGYVDKASGMLLPGHRLAAQFALLFLLLWASIGGLKYWSLARGFEWHSLPSSLGFLAVLVGLLALTLSALAFFFDRYRVPVLMPWIALLAVTSLIPSADHMISTGEASLPGAVALQKAANFLEGQATPVIVSASGGGIAAAAWTAMVLTHLEEQNPDRFAASLTMFSGASGGSVGGMHFVSACRGGKGCAAALPNTLVSSLDAAAWGLAGPDLLRAVVPLAGEWLGEVNRGWALEQAWDPHGLMRAPLSSWRGTPAVVFNATAVENGQGIALGNVELGGPLSGLGDLPVVTAARLSASFPFVTPAGRLSGSGLHLVDGGYYDNYGVGAVVAFLRQAYFAGWRKPLPRRVLLIEIRASPSQGLQAQAPAAASPLFQWLSPVHTMLNVRDTAQRDHNDVTLALLTQALAAMEVNFERVQFEIPRAGVPLSWHLTRAQIAALHSDWRQHYESSTETRAVTAFLAQHQ